MLADFQIVAKVFFHHASHVILLALADGYKIVRQVLMLLICT